MNKENAKDYLPLVQALAEGQIIQIKILRNGAAAIWTDDEEPDFNVAPDLYRIKPQKQWARLALLKDDKEYFSGRADKDFGKSDNEIISSLESHYCADFVRWLTDRIEYELPEGDA